MDTPTSSNTELATGRGERDSRFPRFFSSATSVHSLFAVVVSVTFHMAQHPGNSLTSVYPCFVATQSGRIAYEFTARKAGPSGISHLVQGGVTTLEAGVQHCVSKVRISFADGDRFAGRVDYSGPKFGDGSASHCFPEHDACVDVAHDMRHAD